jgi:hypothetical protein
MKTKKILYAMGDSMVYGMEILGDHDRQQQNKELAFPRYVYDALGCTDYFNNSYIGATNEFICRKVILDLHKLEKEGVDPRDVFVIVGVTSLHRFEIDGNGFYKLVQGCVTADEGMLGTPWQHKGTPLEHVIRPPEYNTNGTIFVTPDGFCPGITPSGRKKDFLMEDIFPFLVQYIWTDQCQLEAQEARLLGLHEMLKAKGYDHVFVNTIHGLHNTIHLDLNSPNFYKLNSFSFFKYGFDNFPLDHREGNHFGAEPHKAFGKILVDHITKNILH